MIRTSQAAILGIISFLVVIGFSVPATTYAWYGPVNFNYDFDFGYTNYQNAYQGGGYTGSYFSPMQNSGAYSKPREQLVVYAFGPTSAGPGGQQMYSSFQPSYTYTAPYNQPQSYSSYSQNSYQMPQYGYSQNPYSYQPSYGYRQSGGYGQPTGNVDFFGNELCNWGYDYQGYPCDRDPHQWIHDPYTGGYY